LLNQKSKKVCRFTGVIHTSFNFHLLGAGAHYVMSGRFADLLQVLF